MLRRRGARCTCGMPEPTPGLTLSLAAIPNREIPMAADSSSNTSNRNTLWAVIAGALLVALVAIFLVGGGHNAGQPSAPSGPGNPMQNDQGR
jgi:hypothetical protein